MTFRLNEWMGKYAGWRILERFAMDTAESSVSALARELGLSAAQCSQALRELEEGGLLVRRPVGTAVLYTMAETSLAREVRRFHGVLAVIESGVADRLLEDCPDATAIVIYGSMAGGDFLAGSDMDVLVIGSVKRRPDGVALSELAGRDVNVQCMTLAEWLEKKGTPFHESVVRRHVILHGGELP